MASTYGISVDWFKTTLYVDEVVQRAFKRLARDTQRSEAELMREALKRYVETASPRARPTCFASAHGPGTTARQVDDLLAEGFGRP